MITRKIALMGLIILATGIPVCATSQETNYPVIGSLESLDPAFDQLIPPTAKIEVLATGFQWAEGPVWLKREKRLLFSDVPRNAILQWSEKHGTGLFLKPSGYTGSTARGGEPGSNGLTLDRRGRLVICEHGDRRITRLDGPREKTVLAEYYVRRRFNSPNDAVFNKKGDLYFTDPPYGLEQGNDDLKKELLYNGVYLVREDKVQLLTTELSYPNGLAFSPDESVLYVANSDPNQPIIMSFPVKRDGELGPGQVFFDASELAKSRSGLPDGMKVDRHGNLFATGPGGVLVLSPAGQHLGTILTGDLTSNCAWGNDGSILYMTVNDKLCRIQTNTRGTVLP